MNDDPTLPFGVEHAHHAPSQPSMPPPAATTWGPFRLLARVGHGGFGEVYRAWDPNLEREVALKLLLPTDSHLVSHADTEADYQAMLREARALASVRHPNIVPIYGIDRHHGRVGFWTDFVRGKTLATLLHEQGSFGYREAAGIGLDLAKALSAVHRTGILHRDIKAENVMREEGGRILLMDFGLSTLPQRQLNIAGTPNYMAPELFDGSPATVCSDIYALGILLFYLVAGEFPVRLTDLDPAQAIAAIDRRTPLMDLRPDLPESFLRAVHLAIKIDPARRVPSAGHLATALAECLGTALPLEAFSAAAPGIEPAPPPQPSAALPPAGPSHRRRALLGVGFALVLLLPAATRVPVVRHWLRLDLGAAAAGVAPTVWQQYEAAHALLLKSYKDANTAAAVQGFLQIVRSKPNFALAHSGLAAAYFIQSSNNHDTHLLDLAKQEANLALSLKEDLVPATVTLARIAAEEGRTDDALQLAEHARSLDPNNPEVYGALADVYHAQNLPKQAIDALNQAIDVAPDDWRWPVSLGIAQFSAGNAKEAAEQLQKGVDLAPDNAAAHYDLGIANLSLDRLEESRKELQASLKIQQDPDTYAILGILLTLEGRYAEAADTEKKAIALNPNDYVAWGNLAGAYRRTPGDRAQAQDAFRNAIRLAESERSAHPKNASLLASLAAYYAATGESRHSQTLARQALALAPGDPTVAFRVGTAYEILGERSASIPLVASAVAKGYNSAEFTHDPELASLRTDPVFLAALSEAKANVASDRPQSK